MCRMRSLAYHAAHSLLTLFVALSTAAPALAQANRDAKSGPPYDVQGLEPGYTWITWVFAFLFIALCAATCFKNPHRTPTREN